MSRIRGRDTGPELLVRSLIHAMGLRFRLHRADLPGKPDIVLPGRRVVILVHGCFWHRHKGCRYAYTPKTRRSFWKSKFLRNVLRDRIVNSTLKRLGWRVQVVWECETRDPISLEQELRKRLLKIPELACERRKGTLMSSKARKRKGAFCCGRNNDRC